MPTESMGGISDERRELMFFCSAMVLFLRGDGASFLALTFTPIIESLPFLLAPAADPTLPLLQGVLSLLQVRLRTRLLFRTDPSFAFNRKGN